LNFIFQSMVGSYKHSWEIENKRCEEAYGTKYTAKNLMIYSTLSSLLFPLTGFFWLGYKAALLQFVIALISSSLLEIINYIEHYGLTRRFISPLGKYENVNISHSWNAPYRVSNYWLFKLLRHSDHHENSLKPYQVLASYDESPCLPQGYSVCVIIATIPSIWFEVMNPLVEIYRKGLRPSKDLLDRINSIIYKYVFYNNVLLFSLVLISEALRRRVQLDNIFNL